MISESKINLFKNYYNSCNNKGSLIHFILDIYKNGLDEIDLNLIKKEINEIELSIVIEDGVDCVSFLKQVLAYVSECCNYKCIYHPNWCILAGRIELLRLKLNNPYTFEEGLIYSKNIWDVDYYDFISNYSSELLQIVQSGDDIDNQFTLFGLKTLEKSYLLKYNDIILETPSLMYLRVATYLFFPDLEKIKNYYNLMSKGYFTHASPTLFNAGIKKGSLSSCFLLSMEDSLEEIFKCLGQCALISKFTGGIGLDISNIRHSSINNTSGSSSGIVPMLQVYNSAMKYVDQGGRRKGSATVFLQPWHIDFMDFLMLKRSIGSEERRARDLFYAVWCCDLFMLRVKNNQMWSLFCPKKCPKLTNTYGDEFNLIYLEYEKSGLYDQQIMARDLWNEMLKTQVETGMPFIAYKDTANYTSNQKNLGLIRSSNLCMEIVEVTDKNTISSCNLASIALDEFVVNGEFQYFMLGNVVKYIVEGLNNVIDRTCYPLGDGGNISITNKKYRPLGIGVQGLAETFFKLKLAWTDDEAKIINKKIFATIYYYALSESCFQSKINGPYDGFYGSPASSGILKPILICENKKRLQSLLGNTDNLEPDFIMYKWDLLQKDVKRFGLRNSLLVALMPTASSAQIRGKTESFEPITSNMYVRTVLSGSFPIVNKYMVDDLIQLNMWNNTTIHSIMKEEGSIQHLQTDDLSIKPKLDRVKDIYKTAFELKQKVLVDLAIDRSPYVCQSQSLNIFIKNPTFSQLTNLHFYSWEHGLTTGMYYLRTSPSTEAIKFTVEIPENKKRKVCDEEVCLTCQS